MQAAVGTSELEDATQTVMDETGVTSVVEDSMETVDDVTGGAVSDIAETVTEGVGEITESVTSGVSDVVNSTASGVADVGRTLVDAIGVNETVQSAAAEIENVDDRVTEATGVDVEETAANTLNDTSSALENTTREVVITVRCVCCYCYCPQRSCGKVMFLHLSVNHSVHGGVFTTHTLWADAPPRQTPPGQTNPHGQTTQCMLGYTPLPSACWDTHTPLRSA